MLKVPYRKNLSLHSMDCTGIELKMIQFFEKAIQTGLIEDVFQWDWTTQGVFRGQKRKAVIVAKSEGVWACDGVELAINRVLVQSSLEELKIKKKALNGKKFKSKDVLLELEGCIKSILIIERSLLNVMAMVCGVSSRTRYLIDCMTKIKNNSNKASKNQTLPRISCTRKTLPGYKDLLVHAVICGGGYSHRLNLASGVLIKENHISVAGSIEKAVVGVRNTAPHGLKVEIEVRNIKELKEALRVGVEGVLLDNFTPQQVLEGVQTVKESKKAVFIEVSGGISGANIGEYLIPGVDVISSGSLTNQILPVDLSLLMHELT